MIGRIAGRIVYRGTDHVLIDCAGVGYVVHVSDRTLAGLPAAGEAAALFTELTVREDLLQLHGFPTLQEKEWHRLLTSVQGIGAKASMGILGALGPEGVSRAIAMGDWTAVRAAPGVGPKLAQRVVNELKDKAPAVIAMGTVASPAAPEQGAVTEAAAATPLPEQPVPVAAGPSVQAETLSALVNLGYGHGEAAAAMSEAAAADPEAGTSALIRAALRLLAPKG